jgi:hypothetical protein
MRYFAALQLETNKYHIHERTSPHTVDRFNILYCNKIAIYKQLSDRNAGWEDKK